MPSHQPSASSLGGYRSLPDEAVGRQSVWNDGGATQAASGNINGFGFGNGIVAGPVTGKGTVGGVNLNDAAAASAFHSKGVPPAAAVHQHLPAALQYQSPHGRTAVTKLVHRVSYSDM